jgi:hypothetical protein
MNWYYNPSSFFSNVDNTNVTAAYYIHLHVTCIQLKQISFSKNLSHLSYQFAVHVHVYTNSELHL